MPWNKLKSMFVVTDSPAPSADADVDQTLKDLEKYQVPGDGGNLPPGTDAAALSGRIDFQALYDQAGVPNTCLLYTSPSPRD